MVVPVPPHPHGRERAGTDRPGRDSQNAGNLRHRQPLDVVQRQQGPRLPVENAERVGDPLTDSTPPSGGATGSGASSSASNRRRACCRCAIQSALRRVTTRSAHAGKEAASRRRRSPRAMATQLSWVTSRPLGVPTSRRAWRRSRGCQRTASRSNAGLTYDGSEASLNGALAIGNNDLAIGALVLSEGVAGRACSVWKFYGDTAPATGDPVKVFDGVCDSADIPENGPVRITLQQSGGTTTFCPRTYLTAAAGFSFLPTPGQIVTWNDETVRLSPEGL